MSTIYHFDFGHIQYEEALNFQHLWRNNLIDARVSGQAGKNLLALCEHQPVITWGSQAKESELKTSREQLHELGISIVPVRRGGAITFHGPGQITGYPLFDLEYFKTDIRWYIQRIADGIIKTLAQFGINGYYDQDYPGVWIADQDGSKRKICAMGVHLSRWVSIHGFALNVSTDMSLYDNFVPCAIDAADRTVTSMEQELGTSVDINSVKRTLVKCIAHSFEAVLEELPIQEIENKHIQLIV